MSADIDKDRADFEAHIRSFNPHMIFVDRWPNDGDYKHHAINEQWKGWQARAAIPAERQQRAPDQHAHDIGMAHIICDQAGIPQGEIIGRLVALSGKGDAAGWISVTDRLPPVGQLVMVFSPLTKYDWPDSLRINFDCIDPDADEPTSWLAHNEHYDHFSCVAKPEGSVGPSAEAPYTHWMEIPATQQTAPSQAKSEGDAK